MRVRVIPVEAAAIAHGEVVSVSAARLGERHPTPIVARIDRQTVPVHDRRLADAVHEIDAHALIAMQHQCRIEISAPADLREVRRSEPGGSSIARRERGCAQRERIFVE